MEQEIRFCTTPDGVRIAYATVGHGPPLVIVSAWLSHLQSEWAHRSLREFWEGLAKGRRLIRYDKRGVGLSDRDVSDLSFETRVRDLEAVVDALGLEQCDLMGMSEGGATSIAYTVRHPAKVDRLVLYGSYARAPTGGRLSHGTLESVLALIRAEWGMGSAALASIFVPDGGPAQVAGFNELQRVAATGETVAEIIEETSKIDVTHLLKDVRAPTLVLHRKGDGLHPFDLAREIATAIPDARLVPLEGETYPPWLGDSQTILRAVDSFLGGAEVDAAAPDIRPAARSQRSLVTILFTDMESSTALTQRLGDAGAQELVRAHNAIVREALRTHAGSEIKHTGDGIMASFPSASGALACGVAIQRAVAEQSDSPLRIRIGLNAGEPLAEEDDLFGASVQLARRVCDHAEPGQIVVADVVRQLATGKGFLFSDLGDVVPKGFEDPVRLYEVPWREEG